MTRIARIRKNGSIRGIRELVLQLTVRGLPRDGLLIQLLCEVGELLRSPGQRLLRVAGARLKLPLKLLECGNFFGCGG